jgi:4-amino-4-deoxy-L-arabinose transferase-like glycosyltransferase
MATKSSESASESKAVVSGAPSRRFRSVLLGIVLLAAGLRLAAVIWIPTQPVSDGWSYFQRASNVLDSGRYEAIPGRPDATFPPGYPLLLAASFLFSTDRLVSAKILNVLLGAASVWLVGRLGRRLMGERVGLLSAAILAFMPRSVLMPALIRSENLFIPLLLLWLLLALEASQSQRPWRVSLLAGALLGCLTLVRTVAYALSLVWLFALRPQRARAFKTAGHWLLVLAVQHTLMIPWALHNLRTLGEPILLSTVGGADLLMGNNPSASGGWYPWAEYMRSIDPLFDQQDIVDQDRRARQVALGWIAAHPGSALRLYFEKWRLMFADDRYVGDFAIFVTDISPPWPPQDALPGPHVLKANENIVVGVLNGSYWALMALEILGVIAWLGIRWKEASAGPRGPLLLLATAAYFPAVSAVFLAQTRFRWPATDLMIPFAAFLLVQMAEWLSRRSTTRPPPPGQGRARPGPSIN